MFDVGDLPVLTFGNCVLKTGVIKWPLKLYLRLKKLFNVFFQNPKTWLLRFSSCCTRFLEHCCALPPKNSGQCTLLVMPRTLVTRTECLPNVVVASIAARSSTMGGQPHALASNTPGMPGIHPPISAYSKRVPRTNCALRIKKCAPRISSGIYFLSTS